MLHVNMFDFCFCPVTCRVDCFNRSLVRDNWAIRAILEYWFSGCCNKTCPECFSFRILCKSMSCSVRNVEYMCSSYTNGCTLFCMIAYHLLGRRWFFLYRCTMYRFLKELQVMMWSRRKANMHFSSNVVCLYILL